jgi:AmmeMemoRadiSam system protein A
MERSVVEKTTLIRLAREALRLAVRGSAPDISHPGHLTTRLQRKAGTFVSIYNNQTLRGSMGYVLPVLPIWQAVRECAVYAAFRDPRFSPLTADELNAVNLEISILTSRGRATESSDIRAGTHGIILRKGFHQAAMLSHNPELRSWDARSAPACLRRELGLGPEERDEAVDALEIFTVEVFRES